MQQNDETRFEDFVGLISGLYKEIQRIKTSEGARLGLKGLRTLCACTILSAARTA